MPFFLLMRIYTQCGNKLNFSNEVGGQEKDFAGPLHKSLNCARGQYKYYMSIVVTMVWKKNFAITGGMMKVRYLLNFTLFPLTPKEKKNLKFY
ncbi:hypothetical protein BGP_1489 [Beggiatoa sp. PS]|nr:hypothetical protein BGP_1489 [Beggiatoa sp. PS]